jgi:cytosine/adenosine deaminase-related metal-dependent hydrolase
MIVRARVLVPISAPMIRDGAVAISGNRIRSVGRWRDVAKSFSGKKVDLGEVVLMPGLVNAHCHLDYTNMAGQFPPPKLFIDWLKVITSTKAGWNASDYIESWRHGAEMLVRTGTTTVGDIEAVPELLPDVWSATPLRVISFLEMIGITNRRSPEGVLQLALEKISGLRHNRCSAGLSPHAPYSTLPELLRLSARAAQRRRWPVCTHVAESALEYSMFSRAEGAMFDWLKHSGRNMSDCGHGTPVRHLERCGALHSRLVAAHANYLGRGDVARLRQGHVSIVHCPRSHTYFGHQQFPLRRLVRAGVNVCLGTDSLASVLKARRQTVELNMFEEMRTLAGANSWLSSQAIVRMATVNGARALGLQGQVGEVSAGRFADLIAVPQSANPGRVYDSLVQHSGHVSASLIDGRWAIPPQ